MKGQVGICEVPKRSNADVEVSILLLVTFRECRSLAVEVWMVARGHSSLVDSNSLRTGLGSSECGEELARRLLLVSMEPDRELDARPN